MPYDLVAFYESQQATALSGVAACADDIYRVSGDDLYIQDVAPFLAGLLQVGITVPKYCEVRQPSLLTPYRFYKSTLGENTSLNSYDGFTDMLRRPLPLKGGEKMNVYLQNAANEASLVVAVLASGALTQQGLDAVKPTHSITGYIDQAATAGAWTSGAITWDQSLPSGRYAIVGMSAASYKAANPMVGALRLKLLDTTWRPGCLTTRMTADKTNATGINPPGAFEQLPLMPDISFKHDQMPTTAEIISPAAMTDYVLNLTLQKIG